MKPIDYVDRVINAYLALMSLKWRHAGQACITANRVYVQSGVYEKFAAMLTEATAKLVVGHGADKTTTMGPVTTPRSLDKALGQVEDARKHGGQVVLGGGKVMGTSGYFFEPTIILGAKKEMQITQEETFGPVLALYSFETEEEAVTAANNTSVSITMCRSNQFLTDHISDGIGIIFFYQEHRPNLETFGESRGWDDWHEHW